MLKSFEQVSKLLDELDMRINLVEDGLSVALNNLPDNIKALFMNTIGLAGGKGGELASFVAKTIPSGDKYIGY